MASIWGAMAHGLSRGLGTYSEFQQQKEVQRRKDEEQRKKDEEKRRARDVDDYLMSVAGKREGAYVDEPGAQGGAMFQQINAGQLGPVGQPTQRDVRPSDYSSGASMDRVRFDPDRSQASRLQRDRRITEAERAIPKVRPKIAQEYVYDPITKGLVRNRAEGHGPAAAKYVADSTAQDDVWRGLKQERGDKMPAPQSGGGPPAADGGPDWEKAKADPDYAAWLRKKGYKF